MGNIVILENGAEKLLPQNSREVLEGCRHTAMQVLAQAAKQLYGQAGVKLGDCQLTEDGFYYDLDVEGALSQEEVARLEQEMEQLIRLNKPVALKGISRMEADALWAERGEHWKMELLRGLPIDVELCLFEQESFAAASVKAPFLPSVRGIGGLKLLHAAGAYWQGDSSNRMLQRVYGTAFPSREQLEELLQKLEEAKARDHRKLGRELELFMFSEEAPGMPFYLPKGMAVRQELEQLMRELHGQRGYEEVRTPLMMNNRLWEQSGHWDHYKDNMYFTQVDDARFALKPMNCPGHMLIFSHKRRSYRDLPIRVAEFGQVHRHEFSGALGGMMRVRTFCQDDAHLFVLPEQIGEEIGRVIQLIDEVYKLFGFEYQVELSTRPEDSMGSEELWEQAEASLRQVLQESGIPYRLNEGDGAFYGPKIDFHIKDALGRSWQCGTIQLDFQMPEKFNLSYVGSDNKEHRPVVIHRAVYGAIDRFLGILTEHYAGAFPLWLAPVQVKVLPVSKVYGPYAEQVCEQLRKAGIRVEIDCREEKLGYRIREAELAKMPYMLILGAKEQDSGQASLRGREAGDLGMKPVGEIADFIAGAIRSRAGCLRHWGAASPFWVF